MANFHRNQVLEGQVVDLTSKGEGVIKIDQVPFFVAGAIPEELVRFKIILLKKNFGIGRLLDILEESPNRVALKDPIGQQIGTMTLQHMDYPSQLSYKKGLVEAAFKRIGQFEDIRVEETLGMDHPWAYRNKAQIPVRMVEGQLETGFFRVYLFKGCDKNINKLIIHGENFPNEYLKRKYPAGYINLGVAHGLAMPLFLLAKAYRLNLIVNNHENAINSIINLYINLSNVEKNEIYIPGLYSLENQEKNPKKHDERNGWCYGRLSIMSLVFYACNAIKRDGELFYQSILQNLKEDIRNFNLTSPTFCHGYSGLLLTLDIIMSELDDLEKEQIVSLKKDIVNKIEEYYSEDNRYLFKDWDYEYTNGLLSHDLKSFDRLGFLSGTTGILLNLMSFEKAREKSWKSLFTG